MQFAFSLLNAHKKARQGIIETVYSQIRTPAFMPVGTRTVKAIGSDIIYHLMLKRGAEGIAKFGGLRNFINWSDPVLTDSRGQVMSLSNLRKISEDGVEFRSNIDGSKYMRTSEGCTQYTKGYLHQAVKVGEIISSLLMTWYNIQYFQGLMARIRGCIVLRKDFDS